MTAQRRFVRRTVLAVTASVAALTLAACGSDGDGKASSGTATASGTAAAGHNAADVSFSKEMIQHHRQAVEMAGLAAGHASSAQVKSLATKIEGAQAPEIKQAEGATQGEGGGKTVHAVEKEFSIKLDGGDTLKPGRYRFQVMNKGKIEHDLAVEGNGVEDKTALIPPGNEAALEANLAAGKYKLYCTVPGHEQSGMKIDLSVR